MKKILIGSIDTPFIGGAGTNSYNIIKLLRAAKHQVVGLYIYTDKNQNKDPHEIGNILSYNPKLDKLEEIKDKIKYIFSGEPDYMIAKNYIPVFFLKKMFSNINLTFLPSGSAFYNHYINKFSLVTMSNLIEKLKQNKIQLNDIVKTKGKLPCYPDSCLTSCDCELRAMILSNVIIPNSDITENLLKLLYKNVMNGHILNKITSCVMVSGIYDLKSIANIKKINFNSRKYDFIFIAYNWERKLKNINLVDKIINHNNLKKFVGFVVGNSTTRLKNTKNNNISILNYVNNNNILELLSSTRCLICPSLYDSFPNVITEANLCGCNIVTSENVGQYKLLNEKQIVKNFTDLEEWVLKIEDNIKTKYPNFTINQQKIIHEIL